MKKKILIVTGTVALTLSGSLTSSAAEEQAFSRETEGIVTFELNDQPTEVVDPLNPQIIGLPIDTINPFQEIIPGNTGPLSLDYASSFNFGKQKITSKDQVYYGTTQQMTINEKSEERPLFAQVTDGRGSLAGWTLALKQKGQFSTSEGKELRGAEIRLSQGQIESESESVIPSQITERKALIADGSASTNLVMAQQGEGAGTWIYRFGDLETMSQAVQLHVPGKAIKLKAQYQTNLLWTLSNLPGQL